MPMNKARSTTTTRPRKTDVLYSLELRVVKLYPRQTYPTITYAESSFRRFKDAVNAMAVYKDLCYVIDDHRAKNHWPEDHQ